jgi:Flp pilus assembly protein TadD
MCAAATLFAQVPATPQPQGITAQVPLQEAKGQMAAGDFKQAAALLNQLLATDPGSAAAHEMLAYSYLRLDDPQHSLLEYTKAAAIEHPSAVDLQNVAKDYVLLGDTTSAEHCMVWPRPDSVHAATLSGGRGLLSAFLGAAAA